MFLLIILFLRIRRPPRSTRTDTLFPYTTLFRSGHQHILFLQSLEARGDDGFGVIAALPVLPRAPAEEQREREDCDKRGAERAFAHATSLQLSASRATRPRFSRSIRCASTDRPAAPGSRGRSEEHTPELQTLMRTAVA